MLPFINSVLNVRPREMINETSVCHRTTKLGTLYQHSGGSKQRLGEEVDVCTPLVILIRKT